MRRSFFLILGLLTSSSGIAQSSIYDIEIHDIDGKIIDFKMNKLDYSIPHKKLSIRNFVLFPLKEILPDWKHPKTKEHIGDLIDNLNIDEKNSILKVNKY